jgi:hypothetical protein
MAASGTAGMSRRLVQVDAAPGWREPADGEPAWGRGHPKAPSAS